MGGVRGRMGVVQFIGVEVGSSGVAASTSAGESGLSSIL